MPLRELLQTAAEPYAKLRALYTLDGLDALTAGDITIALNDKAPGVRAWYYACRKVSRTGK